jgi:FKBP-type peptidyl-prolyl cis-trans isomerase
MKKTTKKKAAAQPKKAAKKAAKPVAKKAAKKAAPKFETKRYSVRFYNTLLNFKDDVTIGHPPVIGDVIAVRVNGQLVNATILNLKPLEARLDPVPNSKGVTIL